MTTRARFHNLANKLINNRFADFALPTTVTTHGAFDYPSQSTIDTVETFNTIKIEFSERDFDGEKIKVGDVKLIGCRQELSKNPSPDNVSVTRDSIAYNVVGNLGDPADATIIIHARPK